MSRTDINSLATTDVDRHLRNAKRVMHTSTTRRSYQGAPSDHPRHSRTTNPRAPLPFALRPTKRHTTIPTSCSAHSTSHTCDLPALPLHLITRVSPPNLPPRTNSYAPSGCGHDPRSSWAAHRPEGRRAQGMSTLPRTRRLKRYNDTCCDRHRSLAW